MQEFLCSKSVAYFFMQPQMPQLRLWLLVALRKETETTSIFPQHRTAGGEFNQSQLQSVAVALRNGTVCCVKKVRKPLRCCRTLQ